MKKNYLPRSVKAALVAMTLSGSVHASPLTLKQTVMFALDNSPAGQKGAIEKTIATRNVDTNYYTFFPQAGLTAQHGFKRSQPEIEGEQSSPWVSSLRLSLTENIYNNGKDEANYDLALLQQDLVNEQNERIQADLTLAVVEAFYDLSLKIADEKIVADNLLLLRKQLKTMEAYYRQGLKEKNAYLRIRSQVQRAVLEHKAAQDDVIKASNALKALMGNVPADTEFAVLEPKSLEAEYTAARSPALENHYETHENRILGQIADKSIEVTKKENGLIVSLGADLGYGSSQYMGTGDRFDENDRADWSVVLELNYPLWDWGTYRRNIANKVSEREKVRLSAAEKDLELKKRLEDLRIDYGRSIETFRLNTELLRLEQESFDLLQREYRLGKISYIDLITSFETLFSARSAYTASYFAVMRNHARSLYHDRGLYDWVKKI
ncbi:MAG: TolC family protein [Oligoflexales bacterium]